MYFLINFLQIIIFTVLICCFGILVNISFAGSVPQTVQNNVLLPSIDPSGLESSNTEADDIKKAAEAQAAAAAHKNEIEQLNINTDKIVPTSS
jgi:hypothetical protein